jgi:hypothetical protein
MKISFDSAVSSFNNVFPKFRLVARSHKIFVNQEKSGRNMSVELRLLSYGFLVSISIYVSR